jgi:hypothetical protein
MHSSLKKQGYARLFIIRLLVGILRFVFCDLPAFFAFVVTGKVHR